ncbi:MAG: glycosyltransferase family 39 protein [bacterium]
MDSPLRLFYEHRYFLLLLLATFAGHSVLMVVPPLTGDEAIYWNWSRRLALGYPTHPPLTGWLIALVVKVFGTSQYTVRLTALLLHLGTVWMVYLLALELGLPRRPSLAACLLYALLPLSIVLGTTITSDSSLVFLWAASLYLIKKAVIDGRKGFWYLAGLSAGGMMLSKFFGVLFFPGVLAFLALRADYRKLLATREPYLAFLVTLATMSPFLYWNATNRWLTFQFNMVTRHDETGFAPHKVLLYFAGQALSASPVLLMVMLAALVYYLRTTLKKGPGATRPTPAAGRAGRAFADTMLLYAVSVAFPLLVFLAVSLFARIGSHWTGSVYPAAAVIVAAWLYRAGGATGPALSVRRKTFWITLATLVATSGALVVPLLHPWVLPDRWLYLDAPPAGKQKPGAHYFGYRQLGRRVAALREEWGGKPEGFFLSTRGYALASAMDFYTPGRAEFAVVGFRKNEFHGKEFFIWGKKIKKKGANSIFVSKDTNFSETLSWIAPYFQKVEPLETMVIRDDAGRVLLKFYFALCLNYLDNEPSYLSVW